MGYKIHQLPFKPTPLFQERSFGFSPSSPTSWPTSCHPLKTPPPTVFFHSRILTSTSPHTPWYRSRGGSRYGATLSHLFFSVDCGRTNFSGTTPKNVIRKRPTFSIYPTEKTRDKTGQRSNPKKIGGRGKKIMPSSSSCLYILEPVAPIFANILGITRL